MLANCNSAVKGDQLRRSRQMLKTAFPIGARKKDVRRGGTSTRRNVRITYKRSRSSESEPIRASSFVAGDAKSFRLLSPKLWVR